MRPAASTSEAPGSCPRRAAESLGGAESVGVFGEFFFFFFFFFFFGGSLFFFWGGSLVFGLS